MKKLLFFILVILTSGCGIKQIHENTDITRDQTKLLLANQAAQTANDARRDSSITELKRRIDQQDQLIRSFKASVGGQLDGIEQQITRLSSRLQETTGKFSDVAMGMSEVRRKMMGDSTKIDTIAARTALDAAETDNARGNFELAIAGYTTFLERWATSPLAPNAYFGRGQAKLATKDTSGAIADFRAAGTATPPTSRTPTALWQLGKLFKATGNTTGAKEAWSQIMTNFADTPEAARAKEQIDAMKSEGKKKRR